ncbi:zinc-binding domain-containing protein [Annulohypoxylon nitens]|nr:zinc-binding domain-containing protein [Annulohypoxylon nitens]
MQVLKKMPNKLPKPKEPKVEAKASYMYPQLHRDVSKAVSPEIKKTKFYQKGEDQVVKSYKTNVMGKFRCDNDGCSNRGWGSKKVAIVIRGYSGKRYNAEVFNQRCRTCKTLGTLTLDKDSYVERIAYRLKKWEGVQLEKYDYDVNQGPPHRRDLCEGCKRGICQEADTWSD